MKTKKINNILKKNQFNLFFKDVKIPWPINILYLLIVSIFYAFINYYFNLFNFNIRILEFIFIPLSFCLFGLWSTCYKANKDFFKEGNNKKIYLRSIFIVAGGLFVFLFIAYLLAGQKQVMI